MSALPNTFYQSSTPLPANRQKQSPNLGLRLEGGGAVYEFGVLVGHRREVTEATRATSIVIHRARGHRRGYGPRIGASV